MKVERAERIGRAANQIGAHRMDARDSILAEIAKLEARLAFGEDVDYQLSVLYRALAEL